MRWQLLAAAAAAQDLTAARIREAHCDAPAILAEAGLARAETVVDRLYLAGASRIPAAACTAPPGRNAALAALGRDGLTGALRRQVPGAALRAIYR